MEKAMLASRGNNKHADMMFMCLYGHKNILTTGSVNTEQ